MASNFGGETCKVTVDLTGTGNVSFLSFRKLQNVFRFFSFAFTVSYF